ncbi:MAG: hypothetical protein IMY74_07875 [Bacteroidetes bacterium]|nr:hypothetical protein [Bacteroidota bacterium]
MGDVYQETNIGNFGLMAVGCWLMADGWWLVAGGWWLVAGGCIMDT